MSSLVGSAPLPEMMLFSPRTSPPPERVSFVRWFHVTSANLSPWELWLSEYEPLDDDWVPGFLENLKVDSSSGTRYLGCDAEEDFVICLRAMRRSWWHWELPRTFPYGQRLEAVCCKLHLSDEVVGLVEANRLDIVWNLRLRLHAVHDPFWKKASGKRKADEALLAIEDEPEDLVDEEDEKAVVYPDESEGEDVPMSPASEDGWESEKEFDDFLEEFVGAEPAAAEEPVAAEPAAAPVQEESPQPEAHEETEEPAPAAPQLPPAPPPPAPASNGPATIKVPGYGEITFCPGEEEGEGTFIATCLRHPCAGCMRQRTLGTSRQGQGRPCGLLMAWLLRGDPACTDRNSHMDRKKTFTLVQRQEGRKHLASLEGGVAFYKKYELGHYGDGLQYEPFDEPKKSS